VTDSGPGSEKGTRQVKIETKKPIPTKKKKVLPKAGGPPRVSRAKKLQESKGGFPDSLAKKGVRP